MKRGMTGLVALFFCFFVLPFTASAASSINLSVNNAYNKGNGNYDVVVKEKPGTKLALYIDDRNPSYATANKKDWATFHKVKLVNNAKVSFTQVFATQSIQKPINYVRYVQILNGKVSFVKSLAAPTPQSAASTQSTTPAVTATPPSPEPAVTTPSQPSSAQSCTPLTNARNCYEPGEYCRTADRGTSGVAGNGESIMCLDNNGWRWEPS